MSGARSSETTHGFVRLFAGRGDAYGTGRGQWIREPLRLAQYTEHLRGEGAGLGVAPLFDDGTCRFAAVDLDAPDFAAAQRVAGFLNFGSTWIERSRSGNAHVWAFFKEPIEAWVPRGLMRYAIAAAELPPNVEIFPKQDKLRDGMLGNYINLPYFGNSRPMLTDDGCLVPLDEFVKGALMTVNDTQAWRTRARWLMIDPPEIREARRHVQFGQASELHPCAIHIIRNRNTHPIAEGHRSVVYFSLAKMLSNYEGFDHDEAWDLMRLVRDAANEEGVEPVTDYELHRILRNAETGRFTSTGCDDPLMQPYIHPDCKIARNG